MSFRILSASLALFISAGAHALTTDNLPDTTLRALGARLAEQAGSSQWQQLWQRTRDAGHLGAGKVAHFTLDQPRIAGLVAATLADADTVIAEKSTRARYRRDFRPLVVGTYNGSPLTAVCLWVDWRSAPSGMLPAHVASMGQVSLLLSKPCH